MAAASGCRTGTGGPGGKLGLVLLPRRWVVERHFALMNRFRRSAHEQEFLTDVLKGFPLVAVTMLMWKRALPVLSLV